MRGRRVWVYLERVLEEARGVTVNVLCIKQLALAYEGVNKCRICLARINIKLVCILVLFKVGEGARDERKLFGCARRVRVVIADEAFENCARFILFSLRV